MNLDFSSVPDLIDTPDIQSRHIIENSTKKFLEIFASGVFGEFRSDVHNAGRYNDANTVVNADFIPGMISILDTLNDRIIRDATFDLEAQINTQVKNTLQTNIIIPTKIETYTQ